MEYLSLEKACRPILLPCEIIRRIVEVTNIGYVTLTILILGRHLGVDERERLWSARHNPICCVLRLVLSKPLALLSLMRCTKTVLSGSRAVNYFVPGACNDDSDWDFYCENNATSVLAFVTWSRLLDFQWNEPFNEGPELQKAYDGIGLRLLRGVVYDRDKANSIQLMWGTGGSVTECVTRFHSTAPQCFISGFCAVSLYHLLTSRSLAVLWEYNDTVTGSSFEDLVAERVARNLRAQEKYVWRGFKYVQRDLYLRLPGVVKPSSDLGVRDRNIGDRECYVVPFSSFMNTGSWKESSTTLLQGLSRMRWQDIERATRTCRDHLDFFGFFPFNRVRHPYSCLLPPLRLPVDFTFQTPESIERIQVFHAILDADSGGIFGPVIKSFVLELQKCNSIRFVSSVLHKTYLELCRSPAYSC